MKSDYRKYRENYSWDKCQYQTYRRRVKEKYQSYDIAIKPREKKVEWKKEKIESVYDKIRKNWYHKSLSMERIQKRIYKWRSIEKATQTPLQKWKWKRY